MTSTIPIWRFTRTKPARRLYDALTVAGLRVSVLDRFRCDLSDPSDGVGGGPDDRAAQCPGVEFETYAAAERPAAWNVSDPGLEADHYVIGAVAGGDLVGVTLLSLDGLVYVEPLDRTIAFDGGYLWGVEVDPDWRRRGIASSLVSIALAELGDAGISAAYAFVAPDNLPSRTLFQGAGFTPERRQVYVAAFCFEHRSSRSHEGEAFPDNQ